MKSLSFVNSDQSLKVGDLVFSTYHKGEYLYKIINIERRFYHKGDFIPPERSMGDEYNPIAKIKSVVNLGIVNHLVRKKNRKIVAILDAAYLVKVNKDILLNHSKKVHDLSNELFP
jgi:hypothetical protein